MIGSVPQLEEGYTYDEWIELLEAWFSANNVTNIEKKRAIFLTNIGSKSYHTLRALLQPNKPTEQTYDVCKETLQSHYSPKPTEIVQRYKFYTSVQKPNETIPQFVANLRQLSEGCCFKELDNMVRDRLVVGCRDVGIQRKLLSEPSLTLKKALQTATAMEVANQDVEKLKVLSKMPESTVGKIQDKSPRQPKPWKKTLQKPSSPSGSPTKPRCWRCGGHHAPWSCRFKEEKCFKCSKIGHTKSQCENVRKYNYKQAKAAHHMNNGDDSSDSQDEPEQSEMSHIQDATVNKIGYRDPYQAKVKLNGYQTEMEVDTGSPWTMISNEEYRKVGSPGELTHSKLSLKSYTGSSVPIVGEVKVDVEFDNSHPAKKLSLLVVEKGVNLLGRDWIQEAPEVLQSCFELHSQAPVHDGTVHNVQSSLQDILDKHKETFDCSKLGKLQGYQAKVHPQEGAEKASFYRAAPVSYAARKQIDAAIDDLLEKGIITPVRTADFACPIIAVPKPDGSMRICGNFKLTANKMLKVEQYPLPTLEDLLQELEGGEKFSKLDLSHAYHQIELDPEARKYTTINTQRGLFEYTRLPFGIASAPAMFQRTMESLLADIPMCKPYLDDIIISGKTDEEHLSNLQAVLSRLQSSGLRLKKEKCALMKDSVVYLGHYLDKSGLRPLQDKVDAIRQAERPVNQSQLQAYLGLLGYYRKFIPNLSQEIAPLTELLKADYRSNANGRKSSKPDPKFKWGEKEEAAFQRSKRLLQKNCVLTHYDTAKPLLLQTDASPYGIGAVISHVEADGEERPIAFASRTMKPSEMNYAQYEKEGLSIIFGLKRFHKQLHGRQFTIVTDHKPLLGLFGDHKPASPMATARVARWHMILSAYSYNIVHREGKKHQNADALSRLPIKEEATSWEHPDLAELDEAPKARINMLIDLDTRPVDAQEVKSATKKDRVLAQVKRYIQEGWPATKNLPEEVKVFAHKKEELTVEDDVILWGPRVVIPDNPNMKERILEELHSTHPGIVKMKALARSYVWWPRIDNQLEQQVKSCPSCQQSQHSPAASPIHPWEFPDKPWSRIHCDYATIGEENILIIVDAHSKWIEATRVKRATATATVTALRRVFATHGIPETVVTDNGTQFVSEEFATFMTKNGICHIQTAPKHPSSNGLAERAVQTVKAGMKKGTDPDFEKKLQKFLLTYRVTPQETTGKTPSELMFKRRVRTRLDNLRPDLSRSVRRKQASMKQTGDRGSKERVFQVDDHVMVKNFYAGPTWLYGRVSEVINPVMYNVHLNDGRVVRRHIDQMRRYTPREERTNAPPVEFQPPEEPPVMLPMPGTDLEPAENAPESEAPSNTNEERMPSHTNTHMPDNMTNAPQTQRRTSNRTTKTPKRFDEYVVYK